MHLLLVVRFGTLSLDVLLNAIDGRLVHDQALLNLVQTVVVLVLEDHVTTSIVLHRVVGRLLGQGGTVSTDLVADRLKATLLGLVAGLQFTDLGELVSHIVFHLVDVLGIHFHLFVHATFKVGDLLQIGLTVLLFDLKSGGCGLSMIELLLLEVKVLAHLFNVAGGWQLVLARQVLLHVLEQGGDGLLGVSHLSLHSLLLLLVLLSELIDLFLLLVEDFVLLVVVVGGTVLGLVAHVALDFLDVTVVGVDHLAQVADLLVLLLDLSVVLLDAVHETLSGLGEGQV